MKKLFLFVSAVALTVSLNSCSSDSDGGGSMSMKVNGTKKTFKTIAYNSGSVNSVYGYIGNIDTPTESIDFDLATGTGDKVINFEYSSDGSNTYIDGAFTSDVTTNSTSSVKGTFSGTLVKIGGGTDLTITEGTFSAKVVSE
ncbi:MAG: hypothetical protein M0D53_05510 [Flavobacterium sp. JAD_PAG50586_2]|nr:MAG: hypothetical protein M0D53_05510 [Flavobacterium sp. JAD_PAG50586_2]